MMNNQIKRYIQIKDNNETMQAPLLLSPFCWGCCESFLVHKGLNGKQEEEDECGLFDLEQKEWDAMLPKRT